MPVLGALTWGVLCFVFYAYARARAGRLGADTHIILKGGSVVAAIVNALLHTCLMNLFFLASHSEKEVGLSSNCR